MKLGLKAILVAGALALVPIAASAPASARANVGVVLDFGNVAFAYRDGYWDRDHHWHAWRNRDERIRFERDNRGHYYDYNHSHDRNHGWRDSDRYWNHG